MTSASLYESTLKEYYYAPLVEQLNESFVWQWTIGPPVPESWYTERGLKAPWVYVPPPRYKRMWREFKWQVGSKRARFGRWIGGIEAHDDWYD